MIAVKGDFHMIYMMYLHWSTEQCKFDFNGLGTGVGHELKINKRYILIPFLSCVIYTHLFNHIIIKTDEYQNIFFTNFPFICLWK